MNIYSFPNNLIDVEVKKILSAETLWINRSLGKFSEEIDFAVISKEEFHAKFSYAISDSKCFSGIEFDQNDIKTHSVERYGGIGIGNNGGGARTSNDGTFQLKGTGRNILAGKNVEGHHGYGGLDSPSAISEVIFSLVLDKVLPLGAAKVCGLIYVGEDLGLYGNDDDNIKKCWGVILVREMCLRPAHFIESPFFEPQNDFDNHGISDQKRTVDVNKQLKHLQGGEDNDYIRFLGGFLSACANQFAFARLLRISHSTITPSNISLDGRWLDVSTAGFMSSGINYCRARMPFFDETQSIVEILQNLIGEYNKANNTELNPAPLIKYYYEQFETCFYAHVFYLLGIENVSLDNYLSDEDWNKFSNIIMSILNLEPHPNPSISKVVENDPIVCFIESFFLASFDEDLARNRLEIIGNVESGELVLFFKGLAKRLYEASGDHYSSFNHFMLSGFFTSIKRARLSTMFYTVSVDSEVHELCNNGSYKDTESLINDYDMLSDWCFEGEKNKKIVLYKTWNLVILYQVDSGEYLIDINNKNLILNSFQELVGYLGGIDQQVYELRGFNFYLYLSNLQRVVPAIEMNKK